MSSNQIKFILAIKKKYITQKERINKHYTWQGSPIETIRLINFGLPNPIHINGIIRAQ